jgi:hypothetical protein
VRQLTRSKKTDERYHRLTIIGNEGNIFPLHSSWDFLMSDLPLLLYDSSCRIDTYPDKKEWIKKRQMNAFYIQ